MQYVGHQKIIKFLKRAREKSILSHAYIFSGPAHLGKFTLARKFAQELTGCLSDADPDLYVLKPDIEEAKGRIRKKDISVGQIRDLGRFVWITSSGAGNKVAIIDEADRMTISAQNALLKTLEEPPEKIIIVLIVEDEKKLLWTVRSRCQIKRFNPVPEEDIRRMIPEENKNKEEIIFWSFGRPGLSRIMLDQHEEIEKRKQSAALIKDIGNMAVAERFDLAERLSKDKESLIEILGFWAVFLRKTAISTADISQDRLQAVWAIEKIGRSIEMIRTTNVNPRLALENLFIEI